MNVHSVSDVKLIEIHIHVHTAEPLVPDPSPLEVEIAIAKFRRCESISAGGIALLAEDREQWRAKKEKKKKKERKKKGGNSCIAAQLAAFRNKFSRIRRS
jgi:hypothetical protein